MRLRTSKFACRLILIFFLLDPFLAFCGANESEPLSAVEPLNGRILSPPPTITSQSPDDSESSKTPDITSNPPVNNWPSSIRPRDAKDYILGGDDIIKIMVYDEPDLSLEEIRISFDGYINFPLLGKVQVAGLSASGLEQKLEKLLKDDYILDPQVSVLIVQYANRKVFILGAVKKPGSYELENQAQASLLEMISMAGGVSDQAGGKFIVLRAVDGEAQSIVIDRKRLIEQGDLSSNLYIKNNDTIYVPGADVVYIFGEVAKPGSYQLAKHNRTILSAITLAGGFTKVGAPKRTKVIRVVDGEVKTIQVNVDDILKKGDREKDLVLMPEDVIIIPETFF